MWGFSLQQVAQLWHRDHVSLAILTLSPLSSHSMGSPDPELPDTLFASFYLNFQADISALRE